MRDALGSESESAWVEAASVLRSDHLLLGEVEARLTAEARSCLIGLLRYGHAWTLFSAGALYAKPSPGEMQAARRLGIDPKPKPGCPIPWADTARRRGTMRGFLDQGLVAMAVPRPGPTRGAGERPKRLDTLAVEAIGLLEDPEGGSYKPNWTISDLAKVLDVWPSALSGKQRDGTPRCPKLKARCEERAREADARKAAAARRHT